MGGAWRRMTPLKWLLLTLVASPVFALPGALFFGSIHEATPGAFTRAYVISLYFVYAGGLGIWILWLISPRLVFQRSDPGLRVRVQTGLLYMGVGLLSAWIAAFAIHLTYLPGFLGSSQRVIALTAYMGLFMVLSWSIAFALIFHGQALERAGAERELELARGVQRSFLLSEFPALGRLEVHASNVPSRQTSGDYYDVVPVGSDALLLAIADVTGKGMPAALLASMLQASLRVQASESLSIASVVESMNRLICHAGARERLATLFLARIEAETLRMTYTNAGHDYPVVFRCNGERLELDRGGLIAGVDEGARFEEGEVVLEPGDRVLLYTDGVTEASNGPGEFFGKERLYKLVQSMRPELSARELVECILHEVRTFLEDEEQPDDMTVMVLRVGHLDHIQDGRARQGA